MRIKVRRAKLKMFVNNVISKLLYTKLNKLNSKLFGFLNYELKCLNVKIIVTIKQKKIVGNLWKREQRCVFKHK